MFKSTYQSYPISILFITVRTDKSLQKHRKHEKHKEFKNSAIPRIVGFSGENAVRITRRPLVFKGRRVVPNLVPPMRSCHVTWNTPRWTQILTWRDHNRGYRKFYAEDEAHWIKHSNLCQWRLQKQSKIKIKNTDTQTENKVANVVFTTPLSLQENLYLLAFAKFEREREI